MANCGVSKNLRVSIGLGVIAQQVLGLGVERRPGGVHRSGAVGCRQRLPGGHRVVPVERQEGHELRRQRLAAHGLELLERADIARGQEAQCGVHAPTEHLAALVGRNAAGLLCRGLPEPLQGGHRDAGAPVERGQHRTLPVATLPRFRHRAGRMSVADLVGQLDHPGGAGRGRRSRRRCLPPRARRS